MKSTHRQFLYSREGSRIFEAGESIPTGWYNSPDDIPEQHETKKTKKVEGKEAGESQCQKNLKNN